jgi:hypothetical protein
MGPGWIKTSKYINKSHNFIDALKVYRRKYFLTCWCKRKELGRDLIVVEAS